MLKEDLQLIPKLLLEQERICLYGESVVKSKYFTAALKYCLSFSDDRSGQGSVEVSQELCQLLGQSLNDGDVQCLEDLRQVFVSILESASKPAALSRLIIVQYYIKEFPTIPKAIQVQIEMKDRLRDRGGDARRDYGSYRRQAREGVKELGLCFANSCEEKLVALEERYCTRVPRDAIVTSSLLNQASRLSKGIPEYIQLDDVGNRIRAEYGWVAASVYLSAANPYCFYLNLQDEGDPEDRFYYNERVESANKLIRILGRDLAIGKVDCLSEMLSVIKALIAAGSTTSCQRMHIIECFDEKFPHLPTVEEVIEFLRNHSTSKSKDPRREVQRFVSDLGLCFDGSPADQKERVLEHYRERVRTMLRHSGISYYQHASAVCEEQIQLVSDAEALGIVEEMSKELCVDLRGWWRDYYSPETEEFPEDESDSDDDLGIESDT
ncbi:hypothetical protein ACWPKO_17465 [Coraliomargarita sp. W4R53]